MSRKRIGPDAAGTAADPTEHYLDPSRDGTPTDEPKALATARAKLALQGLELHPDGPDAWRVRHHDSGTDLFRGRGLARLVGLAESLHDAADVRRRVAVMLAGCAGTCIEADINALTLTELRGVECFLMRRVEGARGATWTQR